MSVNDPFNSPDIEDSLKAFAISLSRFISRNPEQATKRPVQRQATV